MSEGSLPIRMPGLLEVAEMKISEGMMVWQICKYKTTCEGEWLLA